MADAKMVLMWPNIDQSVTLSQRTATGHVEPEPDPQPPRNATLYHPLTTVRDFHCGAYNPIYRHF